MAEIGSTIKCKWCGSEFIKRFTSEKYCSKECYKAVCEIKMSETNYKISEQRAKGAVREKTCIVCGKPFETRNARQKCCSGLCALEVRKNEDKYFAFFRGECVMCGKVYRKKSPTQVCCSQECSREYRKGFEVAKETNKSIKKKEKKSEPLSDYLQRMQEAGYEPHEYGKYQAMLYRNG